MSCTIIIIRNKSPCDGIFLYVDFSHQDVVRNESDTGNGVSEPTELEQYSVYSLPHIIPPRREVSVIKMHSLSVIRTNMSHVFSTVAYLIDNTKVLSTCGRSSIPVTITFHKRLPSRSSLITVSEQTPQFTKTQTYKSSLVSNMTEMTSITVSPTTTKAPIGRNSTPIDYKLIICVVVPLLTVMMFVIIVAVMLSIRRYRK